ncbi:MAG: alpha/beta hydrolase-fold protein [Bryobacteraceae bacterium]|nr:alpha/beta hydrolase-fold protein [Bryobacteraceae bacterium]
MRLAPFWLALPLIAADPVFDLSRKPASKEFQDAVSRVMKEEDIRKGTAVFGEGGDFLWVVEAEKRPTLWVNDAPSAPLNAIKGTRRWFTAGKLKTGTSHYFHYTVDNQRFGGRNDVPAYLPESYPQPGVPQGKLSEKLQHTSKIYEGMTSDYWIYVPAQYDATQPAALMVWQDGQGHIDRKGSARTLNVIDNLIHQKKIPVMIQVFISPGMAGTRRMRSIQYDTVNDTYARFLRDEILAEVESRYNIRKDGYSRAIAGNSSGGICAFNVAWFQPDQFSRVLSRIGSFTSIQWKPGQLEGGNVYPFKIRKEPKRNIRVWLQDGANDLENSHGSWPLQNIQMANSLKMMGYDYHLSWGGGTHNGAHGSAELPTAMLWLWRDYDAAKTAQVYEQEAGEKDKPMYRVVKLNRE